MRRHFAGDAAYAEKARRISALTKDLSELLPDLVAPLKGRLAATPAQRLAFHPPCTLQHGQQLRGGVESGLRELGFDVTLADEGGGLAERESDRPSSTAGLDTYRMRIVATRQ